MVSGPLALRWHAWGGRGDTGAAMELPSHSKQLLLQLNQQRTKGFLCDVIIMVDNSIFRAHKNVLAASSIYFKSLVLHDNLINLDTDMVSSSVFQQILDFIYTGRLLPSDQPAEPNFSTLLTAASYLQLPELAALCRRKLKRAGGRWRERQGWERGQRAEWQRRGQRPGGRSLRVQAGGLRAGALRRQPVRVHPLRQGLSQLRAAQRTRGDAHGGGAVPQGGGRLRDGQWGCRGGGRGPVGAQRGLRGRAAALQVLRLREDLQGPGHAAPAREDALADAAFPLQHLRQDVHATRHHDTPHAQPPGPEALRLRRVRHALHAPVPPHRAHACALGREALRVPALWGQVHAAAQSHQPPAHAHLPFLEAKDRPPGAALHPSFNPQSIPRKSGGGAEPGPTPPLLRPAGPPAGSTGRWGVGSSHRGPAGRWARGSVSECVQRACVCAALPRGARAALALGQSG